MTRSTNTESPIAHDAAFAHSLQVARLAQFLFDDCHTVHSLGPDERECLVFAALLHNADWALGHGKSPDSEEDGVDFGAFEGTSPEKLKIIANVARYHSQISANDFPEELSYLSDSERRVVRQLAAILRIADGLDASHQGGLSFSECSIDKKALTVFLEADSDCAVEFAAAKKKSDLFRREFNMDVRFRLRHEDSAEELRRAA